jgi:diguanylate cyclase (GGDEF)-like protein
MKQTKSQIIIILGAIIIIAIFVASSLFGFHHIGVIKGEMDKVNKFYNTKINLLLEMASIARERELGVFSLFILKDPWAKDDEYMRYFDYGARFVQLKDQYQALSLSPYEEGKFAEALRYIRELEPKEEGVVESLKEHEFVDISQYLEEINIPSQSKIQALLDDLVNYAQAQLKAAQLKAEASYRQTKFSTVGDTLASVLLITFLTTYVYSRITYYERRLYEDKAMAEATVNSVTDGIIITDNAGVVMDINPVAQMYVRLTRESAINTQIKDVFHLHSVDDKSTIPYWEIAVIASGPICLLARDAYLYHDAEAIRIECTISPVVGQRGRQASVCYFFKEVTNERKLLDEISWRANHDPLTGILNRVAMERHVKKAIANTRRNGVVHALLFVDLDNFKPINDTHGHAAGDEMLKGISDTIQAAIRNSDILARMGGDEFSILLYDCPKEKAERIGNEILQEIAKFSLLFNGKRIPSGGASIGVACITPEKLAVYSDDTKAVSYIFEKADDSCYQAKHAGKNRMVMM